MKFLSALIISAIFIFLASAVAFADEGRLAQLEVEAVYASPDLIGKINDAITYAGADFLGKADTAYVCAANIEGVIVKPAKEFLNEDTKRAREDLVVVKNKFRQLSAAFKSIVGDNEETSIYNDAARRKKVAEQMKRISAYAILSVKETPRAISESYSPLMQNAALFLAYKNNSLHSEATHHAGLLQKLHKLVEESPWLAETLAKPSVLVEIKDAVAEGKPEAEDNEPESTNKIRPASTTSQRLRLDSSDGPLIVPMQLSVETPLPLPPVGGPQGGIGKDVVVPDAGTAMAHIGGPA